MKILVINSGSSSVKFSLYATDHDKAEPACLVEGEVSSIGADAQLLVRREGHEETTAVEAAGPERAVEAVLRALDEASLPKPDAVGYRVVHPGAKLDRHQRITDEVLRALDAASAFAPLHNPATLAIIREMMQRLPNAGHYACFDTVFHQTMPVEAVTYPLPEQFRSQGVRRYGFHGLSCESIVRRMKIETGGFPGRAVIAHLGSGCSVTALVDGRSVDTSMGLTPTGGVVMGTRPGDLDPGVMLYLSREGRGDLEQLETMLNHDSGMIALSGKKNDVKALRAAAEQGYAKALLALKVFTRSVTKAIGGYAWLLGGLDAIVFSGGIGEHDSVTRSEVLTGLEATGVTLDQGMACAGVRRISKAESSIAVWVVPAEEDLMIMFHVEHLARSVPRGTLPNDPKAETR